MLDMQVCSVRGNKITWPQSEAGGQRNRSDHVRRTIVRELKSVCVYLVVPEELSRIDIGLSLGNASVFGPRDVFGRAGTDLGAPGRMIDCDCSGDRVCVVLIVVEPQVKLDVLVVVEPFGLDGRKRWCGVR